jgi:gliding motility-associated-like protein
LKKKLNIILTLCCLCAAILWKGTGAYAQTNLVPNWSFEEYNSCPTLGTETCPITQVLMPALKDWFCAMDFESTPDFNNVCSTYILNKIPTSLYGSQYPHTGNAYVNMFQHPLSNPFNIEYIETSLKDSLKSNVTYCVSFFVSRSEYSGYSCSNFGALFTNNIVFQSGISLPIYLNFTPQIKNTLGLFITDSTKWTKISGTFVANGGEKFVTLGSFTSASLTDTLYDYINNIDPSAKGKAPSYFYDDVSVEPITNAQAGRDKTINCGDTVVIGADSAVGAEYKWFPKTGLNFDSIAFPLATPTITTKYVLQKKQCSVITYDTVLVTVANSCPTIIHDDEFIIPNVFTPNADGVNDVWVINLGFGNTLNTLSIFNRWGILVGSNPSPPGRLGGASWDGRTTSGSECSPGVYYYTLEYTNILGQQKKVNGYVSLFR